MRTQSVDTHSEAERIKPFDLLAVMVPVLHAFDELHVPYYLGGSLASSLHGMQQLAQDIDLVVDLGEQTLDERYPPIQLASAAEMLLFKVQRYQRDGDRVPMACRTMPHGTTSWACSKCRDQTSIWRSSRHGSASST